MVPTEKPGTIGVPLLSPAQLAELEYEDPLLRAEQQQIAEQPAIGAFQEELAEVLEARALARTNESRTSGAGSFDINLGVLPDYLDSQNILYTIANLTGANLTSLEALAGSAGYSLQEGGQIF